MDQADRAAHRIDKIYRAAISDVNAKADATLIGDQAVAALKTFISGNGFIDNSDAIAVDLLGGDKRRGAKAVLAPNFSMHAIQAGERFGFVVRHLDPRHPQSETVRYLLQRTERCKLFSRKLTLVHLLPVVVRVVRVVVVLI
jgi:hypothetical protein